MVPILLQGQAAVDDVLVAIDGRDVRGDEPASLGQVLESSWRCTRGKLALHALRVRVSDLGFRVRVRV